MNKSVIEMELLIKQLNNYRYHYYVLDAPIISDKEFDQLYDELVQMEVSSGIVLEDSPTLKVGDTVSDGFNSYKHKERLYSLAKAQTIGELKEWLSKQEKDLKYSIEYKYDGLSINLSYIDGFLKRATTRGNGIVGEDVTLQAKTVRTIPLSIAYKGELEVQGECIMRKSEFQKYNKTHSISLKNCRNGAAGALRNLDTKITKERNLDVFVYAIGHTPDKTFDTQEAVFDFLKENKFKVGEYFKIAASELEVLDYINEIENERNDLDYDIDGAVVKIDNLALREELGFTAKAPRWAIAFKFEAEEVSTIIKSVIWQVSRTGKVNPLAELIPVELGGATISRATLNNLDDIAKKEVKINSRVFIRRSNDVIPEILGVAEHYENSINIIPPLNCPSCSKPIVKSGVFLYCTNPDCPAIIVSKLEHFASKDAFDIVGLSEKTIEQLYLMGKLTNIEDFFDLDAEILIKAEGFKDKKVSNILNAIENSKDIELAKFIYSLGIANIGKKSAELLAERYKNLKSFLSAQREELIDIEEFGEIMADSVLSFLQNEKNQNSIDKMLLFGVKIADIAERIGVFEGYNVCLTGQLSNMGRSVAKKKIIELGGKISESVSKSVNLLIAGKEAGSKLDKAKKLNIKVIEENEFLEMLAK